jgi:fumarate reductase subunit D
MKKRILAGLFIAPFLLGLLHVGAFAQTDPSFLPDQIITIFDLLGPRGTGTAEFIVSRVRVGLFIALGVIIVVAVIYALLASFKYIQSQGDPGKIEEAQKAIKAIFYGIAAMMIAIVGVILVFVFFGANPVEPNLYQTCLSAPNSLGCDSCRAEGINGGNCRTCETLYSQVARGGTLDPGQQIQFNNLCR